MKSIIFSICMVFLLSCNSSKNQAGSNSSNTELITMEKTICFGSCPVYQIVIFEDGAMHLSGRQNMELIGEFRAQLSKKELDELANAFENAQFFEFESQYTASVTDLPTTYISYTRGGETKKIMDYYGAPAELRRLEKLVETLLETKNWKKIKPQS